MNERDDGRRGSEQREPCGTSPGSARTSGRGPAGRACGRSYDPRRRARGARGARARTAQRHALVLLLAGLRPGARSGSTSEVLDRFADFLDAHVELGLGTIPTFIVGHMSGQNWDPAWRQGRDLYRDVWLVSQQAWFAGEIARRFGTPPGGRRLARLERDAALRRPRRRARRSTAWARILVAGRPRRGRDAADLARRRRLGRRGDRARQRLLAAGARPARRLRRAALVPDAGRRAAPALTPAFTCELAGRLRQAGRPRGVRRQLRLRRRRPRRRLLPAGPAHDAARRRARLARLEQRRLRRPAPRGPVPAPRLRAPLRPHRRRRAGRSRSSASSGEFAALVREPRRRGWERVAGDAAIVVPEHLERVLPFTEPAIATTSATTSCRRTSPHARPTCRSRSCASATASPPAPGSISLPSAKPLTGPGARSAARSSRLGGATVYALVLRRQHREPARPVARVARGALRRPAPAPLRPRRPDRGRRDRASSSWSPRRPSVGATLSFRVAGEPERPRLPAGRAGRRAGRRRRRARPAGAPAARASAAAAPCSAPTRSSTWPRARRASNPESTWRLYSALATRPAFAARPRRRPPRARRARPEPRLPDRAARELLPATPSSPSRCSRTTSVRGGTGSADARARRRRRPAAPRRTWRRPAGRRARRRLRGKGGCAALDPRRRVDDGRVGRGPSVT